MATPTAPETKKIPVAPVGPASAAPGNESEDASKKGSTLPNPQPTPKQKKKDKSTKAHSASCRPTEQKQTNAKTQFPAKGQSKKESNASTWREQAPEGNQTFEPAQRGKRVHFGMDVKKEDAGSRRSPPRLSSSNGSWTDPPSKGRATGASDRKTGIKGKRDTDFSRSALNPDPSNSPQAVLDFGDSWSEDSDGEGSAIDINDSHGAALRITQPALRGILRSRGRNVSASRARVYSSTHSQSSNVNRSRAMQTTPVSLTFTRKDLERAKQSGYNPEAVQAIGHEKRHRTSSKRKGHHERDASPHPWSDASVFGSTVDRGDRRPKAQAEAEDDRIDDALKQARSNGKLNRRTTNSFSSGQGQISPRSPVKSTQRQSSSNHATIFDSERLGGISSSRLEPVFLFRPSDSKENDPGIIVHTQAELDAARRNYYERRASASSSSQYTKKGRKSRRPAHAESSSESDSD